MRNFKVYRKQSWDTLVNVECTLRSPILIMLFSLKAAEFTVTLGQAFDLAYKRYLAKGKQDSKETKEVLDLKKQVEQAKAENEVLRQRLSDSVNTDSRRSQSMSSNGSDNSLPAAPTSNQVS